MESEAHPVEGQEEKADLAVLGLDCLHCVMSCLSQMPGGATHLARCCGVCKAFRACASDSILWAQLCAGLWSGKERYVPQTIKALEDKKDAYRESLADSRRERITQSELCSLVWEFRWGGWGLASGLVCWALLPPQPTCRSCPSVWPVVKAALALPPLTLVWPALSLALALSAQLQCGHLARQRHPNTTPPLLPARPHTCCAGGRPALGQ